MKRLFSFFLLCLTTCCCFSQTKHRLRLMEWNCENLFDTVHDYGKDDVQFLPDGEYEWDSRRYWAKQGRLARTILDAGGLQPVDIIGLCEVENDSVIVDLIHRTRMAALDYEYLITSSRDQRGVDVALLYQPLTFRPIETKAFSVPYDSATERPTRDIMWCAGVIPTGDTLDVVLVHFPSRRGGKSVTAPYRQRAAGLVCHLVDSLHRHRVHAAVMVMGDCNDEPHDKSLRLMAKAGLRNLSQQARVPLDGDERKSKKRQIEGTYYYQAEWSRIDNVLLSAGAVKRFDAADCQIFAPDYLLEPDKDGFLRPFRTYRGPIYHGGYSDHLPLILDMWY